MNLTELQSHAYEVIVRINQLQAELQATQKAIAEYKEPVKEPVKDK